MKILVTGGAGFIGSQVVRELEARGNTVVVLDALTYAGNPDNLRGTNARLVVGDVRSHDQIIDIFRTEHPDAVAHLAADSHVQRSFSDGRRFLEVNAIGTENVIDAAHRVGVTRFLHVSTDEVFGDVLDGNADEYAPLRPRNPYSASKAAAESVVNAWREWKKFPIVMVRLSNCYGPRQHMEKLVPFTIAQIAAGRRAMVHGDGRQRRDWLHVTDAARGISDALLKGEVNGTYNLPGGQERSVLEVVYKVIELMRKGSTEHSADRPGAADRRYGMTGPNAISWLCWQPRVAFDDGMRSVVQWYLDNPARILVKEAA